MIRWESLQVAVAVCMLATGCKYGSVKATGDVATVLPTKIPVLQDVGDLCRLGAATSGDISRDSCETFDKTQPVYASAAKQLASYGLALKELAGAGSIEAGDLVTALLEVGDLGDLGGIPIEGGTEVFSAAVGVLVDVFANGYKKRNVREAVTKTDRAVQCLVARELVNIQAVKGQLTGLSSDLVQERQDIEVLREKLETSRPEPPAESTDASEAVYTAAKTAWRARRDATESRNVVVGGATLTVTTAMRQVEALERALKSFAVAHNRLACFPDQIGTMRDGKLLELVLDDIRCAATNDDKPGPQCLRVAKVLEVNHTCAQVAAPQPRCVW